MIKLRSVREGEPPSDTNEDDRDFVEVGEDTSEQELIELLSRALFEERKAILRYRHRRAKMIDALLKKDPRLAEWKARAHYESSKDWARMKSAHIDAEHDVEILRALLNIPRPEKYK